MNTKVRRHAGKFAYAISGTTVSGARRHGPPPIRPATAALLRTLRWAMFALGMLMGVVAAVLVEPKLLGAAGVGTVIAAVIARDAWIWLMERVVGRAGRQWAADDRDPLATWSVGAWPTTL